MKVRLVRRAYAQICLAEISAKFGSNLGMPVVYYRQHISVAYGRGAEDSALHGQLTRAEELEEIAAKQKYNGSENEKGAARRLFLFPA